MFLDSFEVEYENLRRFNWRVKTCGHLSVIEIACDCRLYAVAAEVVTDRVLYAV
jgi:hypothetical protein